MLPIHRNRRDRHYWSNPCPKRWKQFKGGSWAVIRFHFFFLAFFT